LRETPPTRRCGRQFRTTHIKSRPFKVKKLGPPPGEYKFKDADGKETTVLAYWKKTYPKVPLKYPNLPCLVAVGKFERAFPPEVSAAPALRQPDPF